MVANRSKKLVRSKIKNSYQTQNKHRTNIEQI